MSSSATKKEPITKALASLALAALLLVGVAGCGDGGDGNSGETYDVEASTTVTTASIEKAQYVPRVNQICRKAWLEIEDNFAEAMFLLDPKLKGRKRFAEAVRVSLIAGVVFYIFDGIYRLGAPPGEEREVEEMIGTMQSASERGEKGLAPVSSIAQVTALYGDYNRRARVYGLDDCVVDTAHLRDYLAQSSSP